MRRVRDALWLVAAVVVPLGFAWNSYRQLHHDWQRRPAGTTITWTIALFGLYGVGVAWIALGAWRRTSWHRSRRDSAQ